MGHLVNNNKTDKNQNVENFTLHLLFTCAVIGQHFLCSSFFFGIYSRRGIYYFVFFIVLKISVICVYLVFLSLIFIYKSVILFSIIPKNKTVQGVSETNGARKNPNVIGISDILV